MARSTRQVDRPELAPQRRGPSPGYTESRRRARAAATLVLLRRTLLTLLLLQVVASAYLVPVRGLLPALCRAEQVQPPANTAEASMEAFGLYGEPWREQLIAAAQPITHANGANDDAVDDAVAQVVRQAHQRDLAASQVIEILDHAASLVARDLPVRPVLDRYLQGLAKGVPFARIEAVAGRTELRLVESAERLDAVYGKTDTETASEDGEQPMQNRERESSRTEQQTRHAMIDHAAHALDAGVPGETLSETITMVARDGGPMSATRAPLIAMGYLVGGGIEPQRSLDLVETAWQHGFRADELELLGREIGRLGDRRHGPPDEIIEELLTAIRRGRQGEHAAVFQRLDAMHGRYEPGHSPPGTAPGDDPAHMLGPGGPPDDPGHQPPHGQGGGHGGGGGGGQGGGGGNEQGGGR